MYKKNKKINQETDGVVYIGLTTILFGYGNSFYKNTYLFNLFYSIFFPNKLLNTWKLYTVFIS